MFVFSCHVAWSAFSSGSAAARNGFCLHGVTTLYQAAQWLKNKVQNGAFAAIEDITIIPWILGYSTPHSRVLQKTHMIFRCRVLKSGWLQLHNAHRPIQQWCLSTQSNEASNVGWSSLYKKCLEFRHCLLFDCTAVTANIYTIAMSCPCMISYYVNNHHCRAGFPLGLAM